MRLMISNAIQWELILLHVLFVRFKIFINVLMTLARHPSLNQHVDLPVMMELMILKLIVMHQILQGSKGLHQHLLLIFVG